MIDLSFANLKPPVITMNDASLNEVVSAIEVLEISKVESALLKAIQDILVHSDSKYISCKDVSLKLNKTEQSVRLTLKKLKDKGVFKESKCQTHPTLARAAS